MADQQFILDHWISVAVDTSITRAESPDLNPTLLDREMALDRIEDALKRALEDTLDAAKLRLNNATVRSLREAEASDD